MIENMSSREFVFAMIKTLILLFVLNLISSSVLPFVVHANIRIPISLLFALFFSLRFKNNLVPIFIITCELIQGGFSILGWGIASVASLSLSLIVNYTRDHFKVDTMGAAITMTLIFQIIWFLIVGVILGFKLGSFEVLTRHLIYAITWPGIGVTVLSPLVYPLLYNFWKVRNRIQLGS